MGIKLCINYKVTSFLYAIKLFQFFWKNINMLILKNIPSIFNSEFYLKHFYSFTILTLSQVFVFRYHFQKIRILLILEEKF